MLSVKHQKFCEAIVAGMTSGEAYLTDFGKEKGSAKGWGAYGGRLLGRRDVKEEIARLRAEAEERAGDSVLSVEEKRRFLARVVRAQVNRLPEDSDLWQGIKYTKHTTSFDFPSKLNAILVDNDLAGHGADAEMNDCLGQLLASLRK